MLILAALKLAIAIINEIFNIMHITIIYYIIIPVYNTNVYIYIARIFILIFEWNNKNYI